MATIVNKKSTVAGVVPLAANLVAGELAVNVADKRLYSKDVSNSVVEVGTNPSVLNLPNGTPNGVLFLNGSRVVSSGSALSFDGNALTLGGATPRLLANMSGAPQSSRFGIQNSATNGNTRFFLYPNGTGTISAINGTNNSNPDAADYQAFDLAVVGTTDVRLSSNAVGAAAFLPLTFYTNGSEQMRLTSTGLGIGTSSPAYKLDVRGTNPRIYLAPNTGTEFAFLQVQNTGGSAFIGLENSAGSGLSSNSPYSLNIYHGGAYPILFSTNATERMRLDSSGNLGLGVTPSAWGSNYKAFEIAGASAGVVSAYVNNLNFGTNIRNDNTNWIYTFTGQNATRYEMTGGGQHRWFTAPSGTAGNPISFRQDMTLTQGGNLLVGTTTDNGYKFGTQVANSATPQLAIIATNTVNASFTVKVSSDGAHIGSGSGNLILDSNATERARITSGGNLLVGTTADAAYRLNLVASAGLGLRAVTQSGVSGDIHILAVQGVSNGYAIENTVANQITHKWSNQNGEAARITSGGVFLVNSTTQVGAGLVGINFNANNFQGLALRETALGSGSTFISFINLSGTAIGSITQSGTSNVAYNTSSDYRLKDNQQPLTGSGAFIDSLKPKTWSWTADGSKGVGFIAHEVQEVSPGSVVGTKDAVNAEGKPVYQAMEYGSAEFIANIIAELQSLRARVAALEAA